MPDAHRRLCIFPWYRKQNAGNNRTGPSPSTDSDRNPKANATYFMGSSSIRFEVVRTTDIIHREKFTVLQQPLLRRLC